MERIGICCAILVAGIFIYSHFIYPAPGRKLDRIRNELIKKSSAVRSLKQEQMSGRPDRKVRKLKNEIRKASAELREAETHLAADEERDSLGARILQMAGAEGLTIRNYSRITEKEKIRELTDSEEALQSVCYRLILSGTFNRASSFLNKINDMPRMITMRRLHIEMPEKEKSMQMEVWVTF
jgi:Tfp pilus assembly protein PilO